MVGGEGREGVFGEPAAGGNELKKPRSKNEKPTTHYPVSKGGRGRKK